MELENLKKTLDAQAEKIKSLEKEFNDLNQKRDELKPTAELNKLIVDNDKLKYRINILKRSIEDENKKSGGKVANKMDAKQNAKPQQQQQQQAKSAAPAVAPGTKRVLTCKQLPDEKLKENYSLSITDTLYNLFDRAIQEEYSLIPSAAVLITSSKVADYQCNSAMAISKALKESNAPNSTPKEVAEKIIAKLPKNNLIEKCEASGPGFINVYLSKEFAKHEIKKIAQNGVKPPFIGEKKKAIVDFSSPNIAKEMHVGHLRSTIIGESISRIFEFLGFDVLRLNHVGDWGTQFGMLTAHLKDKYPNYLQVMPPISDLQAFYKEAKKRFDEDEAFKTRAYECVVKLQAYDPEITKGWQQICEISRKEFQHIYNELDITIIERGESYYQKMMMSMVNDLEKRGFLKLEDGRKVFYVSNANTSYPLTIVKSDGGFTYATSDMAALKNRLYDCHGDMILYVIDAGQSEHLEGVYSAGREVGWIKPEHRVEHVAFGLVLGEDKKKFKTRSGDTIRLKDLLEEGRTRAKAKLLEKNRDKELSKEELEEAEKAIAYGCIKYADLSHSRTNDYIFSFDKMLDDKGNTAVYMLYAYTRIRSISRNAGISEEKLKEFASANEIDVSDPREWKLAKCILKYPEVLLKTYNDLYLHSICEYLYELSGTFNEFYENCNCIQKDKKTGEIVSVQMSRLVLCESTASVLRKCLNLLGLKTIERM